MERDDARRDRSSSFPAMLSELRDRGCTVLVTGEVTDESTTAATRAFLGAPDEERYRVLAFDRLRPGIDDVEPYLPGDIGTEEEYVRTVGRQYVARDAAAVPDVAGPGPESAESSDDHPRKLDPFLLDVAHELADLQHRAGTVGPGGMRLTVVRLDGVLAEYGMAPVDRFCRITGGFVRGLRGMGFFFLGRDSSAKDARRLSRMFDAQIRLERRNDELGQRWYLPAYDHLTDWFRLEPHDGR